MDVIVIIIAETAAAVEQMLGHHRLEVERIHGKHDGAFRIRSRLVMADWMTNGRRCRCRCFLGLAILSTNRRHHQHRNHR